MYRTFRMSRFRQSESPTHLITFPDFVRYLLEAVKNRENINRHFQPQKGMCDPCAANYNKVLKVFNTNAVGRELQFEFAFDVFELVSQKAKQRFRTKSLLEIKAIVLKLIF